MIAVYKMLHITFFFLLEFLGIMKFTNSYNFNYSQIFHCVVIILQLTDSLILRLYFKNYNYHENKLI